MANGLLILKNECEQLLATQGEEKALEFYETVIFPKIKEQYKKSAMNDGLTNRYQ